MTNNLLITELIYDTNKKYSYGNLGGLTAHIDLEKYYELLKNKSPFNEDITSNLDILYIVELMIYNIEIDILAKYTIKIIYGYDGSYTIKYNVDIISKSFSSNFIQIMRFIFIFVLTILFILQTISFISEIKDISKRYDKWFSKENISASIQAKIARKYINSELFRKFAKIINSVRGILLISLILCFLYLISFFVLIYEEIRFYSIFIDYENEINSINIKDEEFEKRENNYLYQLKQQFFVISKFRESFYILSKFLLFVSSIYIYFSLNIGKYFYSISHVAIKTLTKHFLIIFLLACMIPSFYLYSYLIFGIIDENYKNTNNSLKQNSNACITYNDR